MDTLLQRIIELEAANAALTKERADLLAHSAREMSELSTLHRAVLSVVPDILFRVDREGRFIAPHLGDPAASYVPTREYLGKTIREILPRDVSDQAMQALDTAFRTGEVVAFEYALEKDGSPRHYENRTVALSHDEALAIVRDITERKQAEAVLRAALEKERELNELKSRFASMAAHEFRTPLASILMTCETLLAYSSRFDAAQTAAKLRNIKLQVEHLADVVTHVMQVARIQEGRPPVDVLEAERLRVGKITGASNEGEDGAVDTRPTSGRSNGGK